MAPASTISGMPEWTEAYGSEWQRGFRVVVASLVSAVTALAMCGGLSIAGSIVEAVVNVSPFGLLLAWTWRITFVGLSTGDRGVRVRNAFRTHIVAWPDIDRFVARPSRLLRQMSALHVVRVDGRAIGSMLYRERRWPWGGVRAPDTRVDSLIEQLNAELQRRSPTGRR